MHNKLFFSSYLIHEDFWSYSKFPLFVEKEKSFHYRIIFNWCMLLLLWKGCIWVQRTTITTESSHFTFVWVPGVELRGSGLVGSSFTHWAVSPALVYNPLNPSQSSQVNLPSLAHYLQSFLLSFLNRVLLCFPRCIKLALWARLP